jgi:hypothetical protein
MKTYLLPTMPAPKQNKKKPVNKKESYWSLIRSARPSKKPIRASGRGSYSVREGGYDNLAAVASVLAGYGFPEFRPSVDLMAELKSAPASSKGGVYVHSFAKGREFYVGISVDVRKRYLQHLKEHKDIVFSTVLPVPRDKQVALEMALIGKLLNEGIALRNVNRPDVNLSPDELAMVVQELGAAGSLSTPESFYTGPHRLKDKALDKSLSDGHAFAKQHAEMLAHPLYSQDASKVVARYIRGCIPLPALTERSFWSLSCLSKGGYASPYNRLQVLMRVSVTYPEVLAVVINDMSGEPYLDFNFYVAAEPIGPAEMKRLASIPAVRTMPNKHAKLKLPVVQFLTSSPKAAMSLLDSQEFRNAARHYNHLLMRSMGQNNTKRASSHNLVLARHLFDQKVAI